MNILDRFTSIDDLLVTLLERIGGVTEEDTHFFSYPNDGTRATITEGTTTLDFMGGTVMTPAGVVSSIGNSLRARGREYCRSLSLQADRDIIIQIGTKSKIPVFAGTWFKVAHLRFTDLKIIAAEDTHIFVIACTHPDSIEMMGESYVKDPVDVWGKTTTMGNAELAVRTHAPPLTFERRGDVLRWVDFESATPNYKLTSGGDADAARCQSVACNGDFSLKARQKLNDSFSIEVVTNDFHTGRTGGATSVSADMQYWQLYIDLTYYSGSTVYIGRMRYRTDENDVRIFNSAGTLVVIGSMYRDFDIYNFSTMKLVVDFNEGKYVRMLVGGDEWDISDYDLYQSADATKKHLNLKVWGVGFTTPLEPHLYFDNIILTENEPL